MEQPDSTTEVPVTDDLIDVSDETNEPKPATTMKEENVVKGDKTGCSTSDDGCPVCHFIGYLGEVTPQPAYDIFVWKDVYKSAVIFFTVLPLLVLYFYCNPIVVTAYLLLGLTASLLSYRAYRWVLDSFQKSEVQHPFLGFKDIEVADTRKVVIDWVDIALPHAVGFFNKLKHYILIIDLTDTLKFLAMLYVTAVFGSCFSLRVLAIIALIGLFTLPKVYSVYHVQINENLEKTHKIVKAAMKEAKKKVMSLKWSDLAAKLKKQN